MAFQVDENHIWLTEHGSELEKYSGKWVAIDQAKLIGFGNTLKELEHKPEVRAAKHPLFHYVPDIKEDEILIL